MNVTCHKCGFVFENHENVWGKICTRCGSFIPGSQKRSNEDIEKEIVKKYLRKNLGEKDANKN